MNWSAAIVIVQAAIILYLSISRRRLRDRLEYAYLFLRVERNNIRIRDRELATTRAELDFLKQSVERAAEHAA